METFDMGQVAMGKIFLDWADRNYNQNSRKIHKRLAWLDGWDRYEGIASSYLRDEMDYKPVKPNPDQDKLPDIFLTRRWLCFLENPLEYLRVCVSQIRKDGFVALSVPAPEYFGQIEHVLPFYYWYNALTKQGMEVIQYQVIREDHNTFAREYGKKRLPIPASAPKQVEFWYFAKRKS